MPTQVNNQRIATNTLLLYGRILLTIAVSLYMSRAVLNALGVKDYGIYNVWTDRTYTDEFKNIQWAAASH